MSCCVMDKKTSSSMKELDKLSGMFDEVILEKKEKYQLLTLRDKANRANYDYIVWLQLKVQLGNTYQHYNAKSDEDMLIGVLEPLVDWIDLLKGFEKFSQPKQLNLFGESENDLEPEPELPDNDRGWATYFKKQDEVKKRNLKKQYTFFELFHPTYYLYSGIDYRKQLPSLEETRELYKKAILKGKDNPGRYDEFWWDNPRYIINHDGLSDIELKDRLSSIRLFLVPYWDYGYVWTDNSYTARELGNCIRYRYYLDGTKLTPSGDHDNDTISNLPSYEDLFNSEFLEWVRTTLNIPQKDAISDEDILKENLKCFFNFLLWYESDNYDYLHKINTCKDWKHFKSDITSFLKEKGVDANGGGSGYSLDGFIGNISLDKKGEVRIEQHCKIREELNRDVDLEVNDYDRYIVYRLVGDEIYKKAFELFNKKEIANQATLFDFAA